jgi:hypothetical protein
MLALAAVTYGVLGIVLSTVSVVSCIQVQELIHGTVAGRGSTA